MAFPNAEIMVPAKDWDFWISPENAAKAEPDKMMKDYFDNVKKVYSRHREQGDANTNGKGSYPPASRALRRPAIRQATPPSFLRRVPPRF